MTGIGAAVIAAAVGANLVSLVGVTVSIPNSPVEVQPSAVQRNVVCAGGVYDFIGEQADLTLVTNIEPMIGNGTLIAQLTGEQGESGAVVALTAAPQLVAATEITARNSDDIRGVLAAECGDPLNDAWLVGGDTSLGRETVLVITNGSDVDATVDIDMWGSDGTIEAPGSKGLVIPAMTQRVLSVAGFAPDELSPVIRVTSNGAPVWSVLQTSVVRGLVAGGLDRVTAATGADTSAYFPIVSVESETVIGPLRSDPDFADMETVLRVLVPGDTNATVTMRMTHLGTGEVVDATVEATAGRVTDLTVDEIPAGNYSVTVQSDTPFVAGMRVASFDTKARHADHAWASAAQPFAGTVAVVAPTAGVLSIHNPGTEPITVSIEGPNGDATVDIAPAMSASISTQPGTWVVTSTDVVAVAQLFTAPKGIAITRGIPAPGSASSLTIFTG